MKLINLEVESMKLPTEEGGEAALPTQFLMVLEDDAENQYRVETNYDTYKAIENLQLMIHDTTTNYKVG